MTMGEAQPPDDSGGFCCVSAGMHTGHDEDCSNWQCERCGGTGGIPLGEHFVSHEMALDAGDPALEGMSMGIEWRPCPNCDGARAKREAALPKDTGTGVRSEEKR